MLFLDRLLLLSFFHVSVKSFTCSPSISHCRFSPQYSQKDVLNNPDNYTCEIFYHEGRFHQDGVGFNAANGMTYDAAYLNTTTGLVQSRNTCSAASREVF
jgi:hypothetical protein